MTSKEIAERLEQSAATMETEADALQVQLDGESDADLQRQLGRAIRTIRFIAAEERDFAEELRETWAW